MDSDLLESHLNRQLEESSDFFWNRLRWELVLRQLPAAGAGLVDVGAGPGFLGEFLSERRPEIEYQYVEPIPALERHLEARFGAEANRRGRDFEDARFVTLMDVLEHQENDCVFLAELVEKMSPGSTLILTVPAMPWLWSSWDEMLGHYRRYTKRSLRNVVATLPLQMQDESYLFPELVPAGLMRRIRTHHRSAAREPAAAEFPDLPRWANQTLYGFGSASMAGRRLWPVGTSLYAKLLRSS